AAMSHRLDGQQPTISSQPAESAAATDAASSSLANSDDSWIVDPSVEPAAWLQQPGLATPESAGQAARRTTRGARQANVGLASVPNMFGDLGGGTNTIQFEPNPIGSVPPKFSGGAFSLPVAGGGSRIGKISENDSPIPRDRIFFSYNHF